MANKQKIFKQLTEKAKEYHSLSGTSYDGFSESFYRTNTANDMFLRIEQYERGIARVKHEKAIVKWYGTDYGAKWYKAKKSRLDEVKKSLVNSLTALKEKVSPLILNELGEGWGITNTEEKRMVISILEKNGLSKFGHYFVLTWHDNEWYNPDFGKKFHLSFNYGMIGSFDIDENPDRVKLVLGMAKFLGNKELVAKLNKIIGEYSVQRELLTKEMYEIKEELRNPPVQIEKNNIN